MKKGISLFILTLGLHSIACAHDIGKRKGCWVGDMACSEYCQGALKVKLYLLIGQGLKPLCHIGIKYSARNGGYCLVNIDGAKQRFYEPELIAIARTNKRTHFNALLNKPFLSAVYRCPSPSIKQDKGYTI